MYIVIYIPLLLDVIPTQYKVGSAELFAHDVVDGDFLGPLGAGVLVVELDEPVLPALCPQRGGVEYCRLRVDGDHALALLEFFSTVAAVVCVVVTVCLCIVGIIRIIVAIRGAAVAVTAGDGEDADVLAGDSVALAVIGVVEHLVLFRFRHVAADVTQYPLLLGEAGHLGAGGYEGVARLLAPGVAVSAISIRVAALVTITITITITVTIAVGIAITIGGRGCGGILGIFRSLLAVGQHGEERRAGLEDILGVLGGYVLDIGGGGSRILVGGDGEVEEVLLARHDGLEPLRGGHGVWEEVFGHFG